MAKIYETEIKVRYAETDKMGIVHHSRYYPWFEAGRTELFASAGKSYKDIENTGIMMPLVETHCRYIVPAVYEDVLIIKTSVSEFSPCKVNFNYDVVRKADGVLLARGATLLAITDLNFKPVNLKKYNAELYNYMQSLV